MMIRIWRIFCYNVLIMSQKIIRIGSSLGVTLGGSVLAEAGLQLGDSVLVSCNPQTSTLEIKSAKNQEYTKELAQAVKLVTTLETELRKLNED